MRVDQDHKAGIKTASPSGTIEQENFRRVTVKQLGRVFLAAILAVTIAAPLPAAPVGRRAALHHVSRFRGVPTFANSSLADVATFDDPIVRAAPAYALRRSTAPALTPDPNTGRILTIVNQKIAFGDGYIPCSTI